MHRLALALSLVCGIAHADVPAPSAKQVEADKLFGEGRDLLAQKRPKEACEKFEQANRLDPLAAGTKLNLGLCYEELGKYHTALKWYRQAQARAAETNLPDHEKAAKEHTVALAAKVPSITIEFPAPAPVNPMVTLDDETIATNDFGHVEVDPGAHVLIARAAGKKNARQDFTIAEKMQKTLSVTMVDGSSSVVLDPGKPRRYAAYGLVAAGAGAWVFTLVYGLAKQSDFNCFSGDTFAKCSGDDGSAKPLSGDKLKWMNLETAGGKTARLKVANKDVAQLNLWGTTSFVLGALAIGGAATLYFTAPERRTVESTETTSFIPVIGPDQVGFAMSRAF